MGKFDFGLITLLQLKLWFFVNFFITRLLLIIIFYFWHCF